MFLVAVGDFLPHSGYRSDDNLSVYTGDVVPDSLPLTAAPLSHTIGMPTPERMKAKSLAVFEYWALNDFLFQMSYKDDLAILPAARSSPGYYRLTTETLDSLKLLDSRLISGQWPIEKGYAGRPPKTPPKMALVAYTRWFIFWVDRALSLSSLPIISITDYLEV